MKINKEKIKKYINKNFLMYILMIIGIFFLLPLLFDSEFDEILLTIIFPLTVAILSFSYSFKFGRNFLINLFIVIFAYLDTIIFFNETARVYVYIYLVISLIGMIFGKIEKNIVDRYKKKN